MNQVRAELQGKIREKLRLVISGGLRRTDQGSAIVVVMAVIFIILTIVVAMFSTSDVTRQALLRSHNELLARQRLQFEMANAAVGVAAPKPPGWLDVPLKKTLDESLLLTSDFAKTPFKELPNLGKPKDLAQGVKGYPGYRYVQYQLPNGALRLGVISEALPYAVMAYAAGDSGNPSVSFESIRPWLNPLWGTSKNPSTAYSGTAPFLMASGTVQVKDFPYGYLYQAGAKQAPVRLGGGSKPAAIAFPSDHHYRGVSGVDPSEYRRTLKNQISLAVASLTDSAKVADQSLLVDQPIGRNDSLGMFFSSLAVPSILKERLSLRQSQSFWLPSIPAIKKQFGILWHVMFHIPAPPDGGLNDFAKAARDILNEVMKAIEALDKAIEALDSAQEWLKNAAKAVSDACSCKWTQPWCCVIVAAAEAALGVARLAVMGAQAVVTAAQAAVMILISPLTLEITAILAASGQLITPASREEEQNYSRLTGGARIDKKGADYWAYRQAFNGLADFVVALFSLRFDDVGKSLGNDVNVVLFGQPSKRQAWSFNDAGVIGRATWNVPPGRTFYYGKNLEIQGNLWVGRGAVFVVGGDLKMGEGDSYGGRANAAEGVVYLEEGSTLVVRGSFTGRGSQEKGSVMVGGPMGAVHGITSSLIVLRDADLPNGVVPGVGPDQLKQLKDGTISNDSAPLSEKFLKPLLYDLAPNLAKVDGPFHTRLPYIARYATTFSWIIPLELPFVIPMPMPNMHVIVFRGLSLLYAPTLNFELGEFLLTHCDWWGTRGEGRVPVFAKPAAIELAKSRATDSAYPLIPSVADVHRSVDLRSKLVTSAEIEKFADRLIVEMVAQVLQAIAIDTPIKGASIGAITSAVAKKIASLIYGLEERETALSNSSPKGTDKLAESMASFWKSVELAEVRASKEPKDALQECSGALVYAGGRLTVGSETAGRERTPLSVGFFVAEGAIRLESETTIGSAVSLGDTVHGRRLLFYPPFTHASIPLPRPQKGDWRTIGLNKKYGDEGTPTFSVRPIGQWRPRLATEVRGEL